MASIGENIRRLREEKGWSQSELARRIGKSRAAISQYEHNETTPRMGAIEDMASVFGVKKREIIESRVNYGVVSMNDDLTDEEQELIRMYRALPTKGRRAILAGLRKYIED